MRYLLFLQLLFLLFPAFSQPKKVDGYTGSTPYNVITQFKGNYFTVEKNDGLAIVNLDGTIAASGIKAPKVGFTRKFSIDYGVYFAQEGDHIVLKNLAGKALGQGKFSEISPFVADNTVVQLQTAPGTTVLAYIDTTGREIVRFDARKYSVIANPTSKRISWVFTFLSNFLPFRDGLTPIQSDEKDKYGFINKELKLVIPFAYKNVSPFSEGLAAVKNDDGNWGYINTSGKLVIPYNYSRSPSRFSSGLAKVKNNEARFGFINKANKLVIPASYQLATHFYKGYALVQEDYDSPALLIDTTGSIIARFPKDASFINNDMPGPGISGKEEVEYPFYISETLKQLVDEGKGIFTKAGKYALIDKKGNIILDFNYNYLSDYHGGKMFAHKSDFINNSTQNTYGIINEKGEMVVDISKPEF
jgi:hypothetical protein